MRKEKNKTRVRTTEQQKY